MITLPDGTEINLSEVEDEMNETNKLQIEFSKDFKQSDVVVSISINGDVLDLNSGNHEVRFKVTKSF